MAAAYEPAGKVALVTGAARGIGYETARLLHARGASVVLVDLDEGATEEAAARIGQERTLAVAADVTDRPALEAAVEETVERFGGLDIVVANAGIAPPTATMRVIDADAYERTIEVDLLGVWRTIRTALPDVVERKGYLLPIASLAAALHGPIIGHYNAAKAGVEGFADALRLEMRPYGVDVGCGYFGFLDTDMVRAPEEDEILAAEQVAHSRMPFGRPAPVSKGVGAIVCGIERRARRVYYPRWIIAPLLVPSAFQRVIELGMARRGVFGMIKKLDERAQQRAQSPV
jgi:NAD(P)-dependent dehydrogenase (short-subunit alcohol dehydrogenase family)